MYICCIILFSVKRTVFQFEYFSVVQHQRKWVRRCVYTPACRSVYHFSRKTLKQYAKNMSCPEFKNLCLNCQIQTVSNITNGDSRRSVLYPFRNMEYRITQKIKEQYVQLLKIYEQSTPVRRNNGM